MSTKMDRPYVESYAIVAEADLREAGAKLAALSPANGDSLRGLR